MVKRSLFVVPDPEARLEDVPHFGKVRATQYKGKQLLFVQVRSEAGHFYGLVIGYPVEEHFDTSAGSEILVEHVPDSERQIMVDYIRSKFDMILRNVQFFS